MPPKRKTPANSVASAKKEAREQVARLQALQEEKTTRLEAQIQHLQESLEQQANATAQAATREEVVSNDDEASQPRRRHRKNCLCKECRRRKQRRRERRERREFDDCQRREFEDLRKRLSETQEAFNEIRKNPDSDKRDTGVLKAELESMRNELARQLDEVRNDTTRQVSEVRDEASRTASTVQRLSNQETRRSIVLERLRDKVDGQKVTTDQLEATVRAGQATVQTIGWGVSCLGSAVGSMASFLVKNVKDSTDASELNQAACNAAMGNHMLTRGQPAPTAGGPFTALPSQQYAGGFQQFPTPFAGMSMWGQPQQHHHAPAYGPMQQHQQPHHPYYGASAPPMQAFQAPQHAPPQGQFRPQPVHAQAAQHPPASSSSVHAAHQAPRKSGWFQSLPSLPSLSWGSKQGKAEPATSTAPPPPYKEPEPISFDDWWRFDVQKRPDFPRTGYEQTDWRRSAVKYWTTRFGDTQNSGAIEFGTPFLDRAP